MTDEPKIKYGESRALTQGEIDMAKTVFGNSIDYSKVRVNHKHFPPLGQDDYTAMTPDGSMYYPTPIYKDDFSQGYSRSLFMHEMTHVWQKQHGRDPFMEGLGMGITTLGNYASTYEVTPDPKKDFKDYNIEQQGRLIEKYFDYKERQGKPEVFTPIDADEAEKIPFVKEALSKFEALNRMKLNSKFTDDMMKKSGITLDQDGHAHLAHTPVEQQRRNWEEGQRKQAADDKLLLATMKEFIRDPSYASCPIDRSAVQEIRAAAPAKPAAGRG